MRHERLSSLGMEENPPAERRGTPRARAPRAAFSASQQPEKADKPAERAPRRAAKAAPPVTFQPPGAEDHPGGGSADRPTSNPAKAGPPARSPRKASQPKAAPPPATPRPADPPNAASPQAAPPKAAPPKAAPHKAAPKEAAPSTPAPSVDSAEPAAQPRPAKTAAAKKAAPAKRAPRKAAKATPPAKKAVAAAVPTETKTAAPSVEAEPAVRTPTNPPTEPAVATPAATEPRTAPPAGPTPTVANPEPAATPAEPAAVPPAAAESRAAQERTDPWAKLIADPAHAPELLALAAVQTIGPRAEAWARQIRTAYPAADEAAMARLAIRQFTRFGSVTSLFGAIAGSYAPLALLAGGALTHAELVLHLAAVYGHRPTDPERAVDLLVIAKIHPTVDEARGALAEARRPAYDDDGDLTDAIVRLGRLLFARSSGSWTAARLANHYFPGTSLLTAVLTSTASAHGAAARANTFYRSQLSRSSGSTV
jgi:hypothetical protein